eukprot:GEMP01005854.1.p1 GENE.GEMP01005854.1~~GEMP01005854.1.p1  ORF type:complete len:956 (+),score=264.79 GEMP01005854.1:235-3102(+)
MRSLRRFCPFSFDESSFLVDEARKAALKIRPAATNTVSSFITDETNTSLKRKSGGLKRGGKRAARLLFESPQDNAIPAMTLKESLNPRTSRFSLKDFDPNEHASLYEKDVLVTAQKEGREEQEERAARRRRAEAKEREARARQSSPIEIKMARKSTPKDAYIVTPSTSSKAPGPKEAPELRGSPELSPEAALARQHVLNCKSVTSSMSSAMLLAEIRVGMDPITTAAALHRLGRHCRAQERLQVLKDERFLKLLSMVRDGLHEMNAQEICCIFWGLQRLNHHPPWMLELVARMIEIAPTMSPHQVSTALYCLSRDSIAESAEGQNLVDKLVAQLRSTCNELQGGMDIVCSMTALSRLKVVEREIFVVCVRKCVDLLDANKLSVAEACQATSALASMRLSDRGFLRAIKEFLRTAPLKVIDIGHLCNALVKMEGRVDIFDAFKDALYNAERVGPRDVASILTALAVAKVHDADVIAKVCANLASDAPLLKSYDISKACVALADLAQLGWTKDGGLINVLAETVLEHVPAMTPRQVAQTINGFARLEVELPKLWDALAKQLSVQAAFIYPENVVQILEAGNIPFASRAHLAPVYDFLATKTSNFIGEESLRILKAADNLPPHLALEEAVVDQFTNNLRERVKAFSSRLSGPFVADALDYVHRIRARSPRADIPTMLDALAAPLPLIFKRADDRTMLRLATSICVDEDFRRRFRRKLQVRPSLGSAIAVKIGQMEAHLGTFVPPEIAQMCAALVSCGVDCPALRSILTRPVEERNAACMLFAMSELGLQVDMDLVKRYNKAPGSALLAWSAIAGDRADLLDHIEPEEQFSDAMQGIRNDLVVAQIGLEAKMAQNERWQAWAKQFEEQYPDRLYVPGLPKQQRKLREDGAEKRLSEALVTLRVPHRPDVLCCDNTYKVAIILPQKNLALDMWSHKTDSIRYICDQKYCIEILRHARPFY